MTESRMAQRARRGARARNWRQRTAAAVSTIVLAMVGIGASAWADPMTPDAGSAAASADSAASGTNLEPAGPADSSSVAEGVEEGGVAASPAEALIPAEDSAAESAVPAEPEGVDLPVTGNPDHLSLASTEIADGAIRTDVWPETAFGAPARAKRMIARAAAVGAVPRIGVDHPTEPGQVLLFKEATPVAGMVNTWDVTLRIEGKDTTKTSDIVLVIDRSGSMGDNQRMVKAKEAASAFVDTLLPSTTTRIAVVSYASDVSVNQQLTNDAGSLRSAINGLNANGGTFTQAGIRQARTLLANSTADYKHIVLLSDGEPMYSYRINNPNNFLSWQYIGRYSFDQWPYSADLNGNARATTASVPESSYDYSSYVGRGTVMFHRYQQNPSAAYYNHGNSAIAEAGFAKASGTTVWSVGLQMDAIGNSVMQQVASSTSTFTDVQDVNDLQSVFERIAGNIALAVRDATVSDPMGHGFEIPSKTITHSVPDPATGLVYNENTDTLEWKPVVNTPLTGADGVKYAEITYRISINDSILDVDPLPADGLYPTNGDAKLTYTDVNGETQSVGFPIPTVEPTLYIVEKRLYDAVGNEVHTEKDFTIRVTGTGYSKDFLVNPSDVAPDRKDRVVTDLRIEQTYAAEEILSGEDLENFAVTYTVVIDGTTQSQSTTPPEFTVDENHQFYKVIVENRPAVGELKITKVVDTDGLTQASANAAQGATYSGTYTCTKGDATTAEGTWTVTGAGEATLTPTGTSPAADKIPVKSACVVTEYPVTDEPLANAAFYTWTTAISGSVSIAKDQASSVTVTNALSEKPGSVTWNKVDADNAQPLSGSTWTLTGPGANNAQTITDYAGQAGYTGLDTDARPGYFKIENLAWGDYTLKESAPPAGYIRDGAERPVKIGWAEGAGSPDAALGPITNTKITPPALPLTGGMGEDWFLIAAGGAGGIALLAAFAANRRKRANA